MSPIPILPLPSHTLFFFFWEQASTWLIAGKKAFAQTPYQLKACVFLGLLYAVVGTLPSLLLKYDLACECETEEWSVHPAFCLSFVHLLALNVFPFFTWLAARDPPRSA